jgi:hypothetical protein
MLFTQFIGKTITVHLEGGEKFSAKLVDVDNYNHGFNGSWLILEDVDGEKTYIRASAVMVMIDK